MEINQTINAEQEAQQKEYKRVKDAMKTDIKAMSALQTVTKYARKTLPRPGKIALPGAANPSEATQAAHLNGVDLRHLFIAYSIFRRNGGILSDIPEVNYRYNPETRKIVRKDGKAITNQENAPKMELVTKILEKYGAPTKASKTVHIGAK